MLKITEIVKQEIGSILMKKDDIELDFNKEGFSRILIVISHNVLLDQDGFEDYDNFVSANILIYDSKGRDTTCFHSTKDSFDIDFQEGLMFSASTFRSNYGKLSLIEVEKMRIEIKDIIEKHCADNKIMIRE